MDENLEKKRNIQHFMKVIDVSAESEHKHGDRFFGRCGIKLAGRKEFDSKKKWTLIIDYAESKKVRIAIENCQCCLHKMNSKVDKIL